RPRNLRTPGARALLRPARLDQEGGVETQVADGRVPDLLRGCVEDALGRGLAREPPADDHLALQLARAPARVTEAQPVRSRVAFQERLEAVGRDAEEEAVLQLDRIGHVGAPVEKEAALGRHGPADERRAGLWMQRKALLAP